ncbi:hypothetical protein GCM10011381_07740 [Klenkia taihuensis]|nr:hypothetical protein GCM10011381_07740 [Klenkia taihuensis]
MPGMRAGTIGKVLGLAGLAGVAATGVVLARDERQRRAYTPDDVRARLHARAEAAAADDRAVAQDEPGSPMVETRDGLSFLPRPTTRRGRVAQRVRRQLRHLPHWAQPGRGDTD